jgi:hypothetical protein
MNGIRIDHEINGSGSNYDSQELLANHVAINARHRKRRDQPDGQHQFLESV